MNSTHTAENQRILKLCPEPTRFFNIGDKVVVGNLKDAVIAGIFENGKIYSVEYEKEKCNARERRDFPWHNIFLETNDVSLFKNDDLRLNFSSRSLEDIFSKKYYYGLDLDPEYQRGYVWNNEDEVALIDSIFNNCDIGKFVFINKDCDDNFCYEILDGKQRVNTILRFFEGRFAYKGYLFNDLSKLDRYKFKNFNISIAEIRNASQEMIYQYFLKANKTGKVMDKEHLEKVENLLFNLSKTKNDKG